MARQVLDHGVIIPAEYSDDWYDDMTSNLSKLDEVIGSDAEKLSEEDVGAAALSNDYDDLDNKPSIPTKTSDLTNDSNFVDITDPAVASGITSAKVTDYDTHLANTDIHVTTADKTKWNNGVTQSYVLRYSSTALTPSSTNSNTLLDNTDNLKVGDKVLDSSGVLFSITAIDTANSTFTIGTALIDLHSSTNVLPIGSYIQFAGSQAPDGFLVCNGGEISRTTYSALFAVIGTTYGSGDGSTTFNLPNLTDRFLQGSSTSGTVKNAGLPNITGYFNYNCTGAAKDVSFSGALNCSSGTINTSTSGSGNVPLYVNTCNFNASNSASIYGNSTTVQPPALTCLICIKY